MRIFRSPFTGGLAVSCVLVLAGCGGDSSPTEPDPEPDPEPGAIRVVVTTQGNTTDPDGYTISFNGGSAESVAVDATLDYPDLDAGTYSVAFDGNDGRCYLQDDREQTLAVSAGETTTVEFRVTCYLRPIGFESDVPTRPVGGYTKITVVDDDGSFPVQFGVGSVSGEPAWSPTGMLAYSFGDETTGLDELRLALGGPLGGSADLMSLRARQFTWSGDGSKLALYSDGGFRILDIATGSASIVNLDGLQFGAANAATAPDGNMLMLNPLIIFEPGRVFITSFDGAPPVQIGDPDRNYYCTTWSADGTKVYCEVSSGEGPPTLVALDASTGAERVLVTDAQLDALGPVVLATPVTVTPDGSRVLLHIQFDWESDQARGSVYSVNPDGSDLRDFSQAPVGVYDRPHLDTQVRLWSPHSDEIVFIRCDQTGGFDCPTSLWAASADGTSMRHIFDIPGTGSGRAAQWLP